MTAPFTIETARPADRSAAFRFAFQHLPELEQMARAANALDLLRDGELDPRGVLVARDRRGVIGSVICMATPGAGSLVWPPQVADRPDRQAVEDALIQHALAWLRDEGAKLTQAMLAGPEVHLGSSLQRNGFPHITTLLYLRKELEGRQPPPDGKLRFEPYALQPQLFGRTLIATYEDTADCPELTGARSIAEILEGHRAQGEHDPAYWQLALVDGRPIGVLLLARMPEWDSLDVAYVGIVPAERRRGHGRQLMRKAAQTAAAAGAPQLTLSVDLRNDSAHNLYRSLGFEEFDRREVYLVVWKPG